MGGLDYLVRCLPSRPNHLRNVHNFSLAILTFLIIYSIIDFGDSKYEDYIFEYPVQIFGWIITLTSVILLPTLGAWNVYKRHRAGKPMGMNLLKPTKKWRPALGARIQQKSTDDILSDMAIS